MVIGLVLMVDGKANKSKKEKQMNKIIRILILVFAFIVVISVLKTEYGNYIEISYYEKNSSVYKGRTASIYFDYGDGYSEENSCTKEITQRHIFFDVPMNSVKGRKKLESFRIDFSNDNQLIGIEKVTIHQGLFDVLEYTAADLMERGAFVNVDKCSVDGEHLWIQSEVQDSQYSFNYEINRRIIGKLTSHKYEWFSRVVLLFCLTIVVLGMIISYRYNDSLLQTIAIASIFFVVYMALVSRPYLHPDEGETKGTIDYYLTNWKLPIFNDPQFYNSFSPYGDTRLEDMSIYYILSGKFTYIFRYVFHLTGYYRLFGVFVFLLMVVLATYWGKKNRAAFIPILLTPQVWYLFSYSTSDAWDFFLCYVLMGEIIMDDSLFNKAMKSKDKKRYLGLAFFGLIAALLFMGKPNFYEVLLLAFVILFFKWIFAEYSAVENIFKSYMFVLFSFIVFYGIRWGIDYLAYGFDKMKLYDEAKALHIADAQRNYVSFKEQGYDIVKAYLISGFEPLNFKSFAGLYGKMQFHSSTFYYVLIGILYLIILTELIIYITKSSRKDRLRYICISLIMPLSYFISVYHSWSVDFQPQGRYVFPILFVVMYLSAFKSEMLDRIEMKVILPLAGCLGMISYIFYGIGALT